MDNIRFGTLFVLDMANVTFKFGLLFTNTVAKKLSEAVHV